MRLFVPLDTLLQGPGARTPESRGRTGHDEIDAEPAEIAGDADALPRGLQTPFERPPGDPLLAHGDGSAPALRHAPTPRPALGT